MEKNIEQILSEIKYKLAELEAALEAESAARAAAEAAAAEAEAKAAAERAAAIAADPIDIDIDLSASELPDVGTPVSEIPDVTTPKSETVTPSFTETRENALSGATVSDTPQNPATVTAPQTRENALSGATASDSPQSINDATQAVKSVNDRSATPHAWRTGLPGSPVRNILSAISLNDRVLFINTLFQEDPALFQSTIAQFNEMQTLDEAEAYIETHFPGWNLDSDIAFRFMMAVRRKLQ
jgi:hypothetical protein